MFICKEMNAKSKFVHCTCYCDIVFSVIIDLKDEISDEYVRHEEK